MFSRCLSNAAVLSVTALKAGCCSFSVLGRGPWDFITGKIGHINSEFGKFSEHSKLMIFSKLT